MDTEFARTFLAVSSSGSFVAAADLLHITQSTVSARIRALEEQLACRLFVRNKAGAVLTEAGRRFAKHADLLVKTAEQARHDAGLPAGFRASIVVSARIGLWEGLLVDWLSRFRAKTDDISVKAEIGFEADIMQGLIDGRIDIGMMYTPQRRPTVEIEKLLDETLIMVSSEPGPPPESDYVYVDWGQEFNRLHTGSFPDFVSPALSFNIGWLGLSYLLKQGGSGYFPERLVRRLIDTGDLFRVPDAPALTMPAWLVYPKARDAALIDPILDEIIAVARQEIAAAET